MLSLINLDKSFGDCFLCPGDEPSRCWLKVAGDPARASTYDPTGNMGAYIAIVNVAFGKSV